MVIGRTFNDNRDPTKPYPSTISSRSRLLAASRRTSTRWLRVLPRRLEPLLKDTQQFRLQLGPNVTDFIQKKVPRCTSSNVQCTLPSALEKKSVRTRVT